MLGCFGGLFQPQSNKTALLLMPGGCTAFIWIQFPGYNPPPGNSEINTTHSARCFMCYCRCCEGLQLKKRYANRFSGLSDPWCQEQTSGYDTLVLLINPNWSECHPNPSIVLLHASDFYSVKMEVYNRGIISIKRPWRWDYIKHFSHFRLPGS